MAMQTVTPMTAEQERFGKWMIQRVCRLQAWVYRATGGRLWNTFLGGPVGLLGVHGRRSGVLRTVPVVFAEDGSRILLAASQGGMSSHPAWYFNLRESKTAIFQIGARRRDMSVRMAAEDEEGALWPHLDRIYPAFSKYRERATLAERHIGLFVLEPTD